MSVQALPNKDVEIIVDMAPMALPRRGLNEGLILTDSISVITPDVRTVYFATPNEMIDYGFSTDDTAYKAVVAYFNQDGNLGANVTGVWVGSWDKESESITDAIIACRNASPNWYGFTTSFEVETAELQETLAVTTQSLQPSSRYILKTSSVDVKSNVAGNLFEKLKAKGYFRTIPVWHESQTFGAALLGYFSGAMTYLNNSAFTLKFKQIIGEEPSNLTSGQVNVIENNNGNVYVQRAKPQMEQGTNADGSWVDEWLYIDKLVDDMQMGIYDLLYSEPKIPQTEGGHNAIAGAIMQPCEKSLGVGFLAPGVWRRRGILNLQRGDYVPNGYLTQWEPVDRQTDADRAARNSQPFYVALTLAGAIQSVLVQLNVSR